KPISCAADLSCEESEDGTVMGELHARPLRSPHCLDPLILPHFQRRIAWMTRLFVWVVVLRVVATDERPTRFVAAVLIGAVEQVTVKKDRRAGFKFAIDGRQTLHDFLHPFRIGAGLIADLTVLDAADAMRTGDHLQAAVLASRLIDGDHAASH